ncbi:MAG: hypothetical protein ACREJO_11790 [Phycisphaerales bacterium]
MSLKTSFLSVMAAVALASAAAPAMAGIDFPPPWTGTGIQGNSTHWRWDFDGQPGSTDPSVPTGNGPGVPTILPGNHAYFPFNPMEPQPNTTSVILIPPGGFIDILVPNYPQPNEFKLIWIQYHYFSAGAEPGTLVLGGAAAPYGPVITPSHPTDPATGAPLPGLVGGHGWRLPFNPPFETIRIFNPDQSNPMFIDWLTIDTICAPSPTAAAMLGLGTLMAAGRRRR